MPNDKLTTTNIYEQTITLKSNTSPIYTKPYRLPQSLKAELNKQIQNMIKDDIIEETQSEWSSPILLVPKKNTESSEKKWRLVVDYRKLNEKIQDDKFPLPNITEILDSLSGAILFSHLDLHSGYYQVPLEPSSRKFTAFSTNSGQFQMKRLPMGLKISPSAFSRVMTVALSGLTFDKCFVYLDDLIVFGRNLEAHNRNLIDIFERLRKVNLKLNPTKCQFLKKELLYLGHIVSAQGVLPDPEKIKVLLEYPVPQTSEEIKRFIAFCNYYRKFIPAFADITAPLNKLCRKNEPFIWSKCCQESFDSLKQHMTNPPILQYPDFADDSEFILKTDASGLAIGSVLCNKNMKPIAYASRPLNKAERNYPTIQKELLAIVWSVKYFRPYLFGKHFIIETDHKPLIYLFGMKDPSSRLMKFRLTLEEYDFEIVYVKGKDNVAADALSRIVITSNELKNMLNEINVLTRAQKKKMTDADNVESTDLFSKSDDTRSDQPRVAEILKKPNDSVEMKLIEGDELNKLMKNHMMSFQDECFAYAENKKILFINLNFKSHFTRAEFVSKLSKFCKKLSIKEICVIKDKINANFLEELCKEIDLLKTWSGPRVHVLRGITRITKDEDIKFILHDFHLLPTSGHAGMCRMINNIKRQFYWPGLEKDVQEFVKTCDKCQKMKHSNYVKEPMCITTTASYAFQKIFLDIVGPLPQDYEGNVYILSLQCELSKFVEAYPLKAKDTITVSKALVDNFILRFGLPKTIATDRGAEFMSSTMEEVCKLLNIEKISSTAYHHQSVGSLENSHKNLGAFLRIQCQNNPQSWSHWLSYWCFSYNTTVHSATKYQPFELVFGRTM